MNNVAKPAFSLIEFTVYLFGFILLVQILSNFVVGFNRTSFFVENKLSRVAAQGLARDVLEDDVRAAQREKKWWYVDPLKQTFVWRMAKNDVGWTIKKGDIVRSIGTYDFKKNIWNKKVASRVLLGVKELDIRPMPKNGFVVSVDYKIVSNVRDSNKKKKETVQSGQILQGAVVLRNRVIG